MHPSLLLLKQRWYKRTHIIKNIKAPGISVALLWLSYGVTMKQLRRNNEGASKEP